MMVKLIAFVCVMVLLLESGSCYIINDINVKILEKSLFNDDLKEDDVALMKQISFIYPGTKWCGAGNTAENYDDLGTEKETDMCCRDHDNCPDIIPGGETKYNLTNKVFYTRLSCDCDETFYNCLKAIDKNTAKVIGNIYFNALQTRCFKEDYPVTKCIKKGGWFKTKCTEYEFDTSKDKVYQWFDEKDF